MFDNQYKQVFISTMDGWLFKAGNDTASAKKDLDLSGWKKLRPQLFSGDYADKNGRAEGWFRIRIKMDTSFGDETIGLKPTAWGAIDLYLDGKLLASLGETGKNGAAFRELNPFSVLPIPVRLHRGTEHLIAIHFVDYLSSVPPRRLKSEDYGLNYLLRLTGPNYGSTFLKVSNKNTFYATMWVSISLTLTLLFWLLSIQNPLERNLRLIAAGSTLLTLQIATSNPMVNLGLGTTYSEFLFYSISSNVFTAALIIFLPFFLATIFKRKLSPSIAIILLVCFITFMIGTFYSATPLVPAIIACIPFVICLYYIISSWKSLRGAQWAIVAGFLASFLGGLLYIISGLVHPFAQTYQFATLYSLAAPFGMLVYVSMRFKEIINEVKANAQQIVLLSEEKKKQALNQQRMLQEEVNRQTAELRTTLSNLNATQSQLIQAEKMASLGELTAGIAHEIQNPLNFVNNFSEVSNELMDEMNEELEKGDIEGAKAIAADIKGNLEKITLHGKRADGIVKGMLQHSRTGSIVKELTDINGLVDEYVRLAYHGLRAKDKSFNATIKTHYDNTIGKINIIPQEMSRVILNLVGNAFFSVMEKKKTPGQPGYEPTITVTTKKMDSRVVIIIADNGNGIPPAIVNKVFQPFFTTKPTGQGTGLGLSISYDIIKKMHDGELQVNTKEGEFAEFAITLPTGQE